jgi:hypothetical protein
MIQSRKGAQNFDNLMSVGGTKYDEKFKTIKHNGKISFNIAETVMGRLFGSVTFLTLLSVT